MERINFTNAIGQSISFGYSGDFMIDSYSGFTAAEIEANTVKGYLQNGYSFIGLTYGKREMNLNVLIYGADAYDFYEKRNRVISVFNPLHGIGTLTYSNDYETRCIGCYVSAMPEQKKTYGNLQVFTIGLTATNPFWYDEVEQGIKLQGFKGGLRFKFDFSHDIRFAESANTGMVENTGDIETPIRIEIKNSDATEPTVYLNESKYIGITSSIEADDLCVVNTGYGNKTVTINGQSAMRYLKNGSEFFYLPIGTSKISLECESGYPECYVYWKNYHAGV